MKQSEHPQNRIFRYRRYITKAGEVGAKFSSVGKFTNCAIAYCLHEAVFMSENFSMHPLT